MQKILTFLIFYQKIDFYRLQNICLIWDREYSDKSELDLYDETIRIKNFYSSRKLYDKKTADNYRNSYVAVKRIVSELSKIYRSQILKAQIEDLNEDCVKILRPHPRNKPSKSVTVGLVGLVNRFKWFS